ncbi:MAG: hypothetical protein BWY06_00715 [Candidatus Latescibacteria bacterium ADurb.Bin168]|nr:MAG: hypothetical protein BWY06_00715 [Candidatus Latescibacteria bacterium ADurb.Bin168]
MTNTPADTLRTILSRVRAERRRAAALTLALATGAIGLAGLLAAVLLEALGAFQPAGRFALLGGWVGTTASATWFILSRVRRAVGTHETIARDIENAYPEFKERLVAGWEFATRQVSGSRSLADAVVHEAARVLEGVDLRPLISWRPVVRSAGAFFVAFAACCIFWFAFPDHIPSALNRLVHPTVRYVASPQFAFTLTPGDTRLVRGDTLTVTVRFSGSYPRSAVVFSRDLQTQAWRSDIVSVGDSARLIWQALQLRSDIEYRVVAGEVESPAYRVTVVNPPAVERFRVVLTYPGYTGMSPDTLPENEGNITALKGTFASFAVHTSKPVERGELRFFGRDTAVVALRKEGDALAARWTVRHSGDYTFHLVDEFGYSDRNPIAYRITTMADEYPSVRITEPEQESDLGADMLVPLVVEARDDFGFDRAELVYRGPDGRPKIVRLPLTTLERGRAEVHFTWDVGELDLLPEERLYYRVAVYDNDRISGPKRAESEEQVLRFPSAAEVFAEAQQQQQQAIVDLGAITREAEEVARQLEAARRELLKNPSLSWETRQASQRALQQQRELNRELQAVADSLRQSLERLQKHDILAPETMEKLVRIQEMMEDIVTPELRQTLSELQNSLQQMVDPRQTQQALQRFAQNREQFEERLDRTLRLLQEAQAEQQLEAMSKRLRELARMQRDVAESFDRQARETLANREQILGGQVSETRNRLERMAEEMRDLPASPSDSLRSVAEQLDRNRIAERLQQVGNRLAQGGEPARAQNKGEAARLAEDLERTAGAMQRTAEARRNARKREIAGQLDRAATDLLRLSMMQEDLRNRTRQRRGDAGTSREGEEQVDLLQGTSGVIRRVMEASQETFLIPPETLQELGTALIEMKGASEALEQNNATSAVPRQQNAMASLNRAVDMIRSAHRNAQTGDSGTGLEELLRQLGEAARRQKQLNDAMQALGQQPSLSPSDLQMLGQMAAEQRALSQFMQQLADALKRHREVLGRLGDLAGEMESAAEEMERRQLGPRLADRQQRILQRLLDAQRSLQQDKVSEQRIARTAGHHPLRTPGALPEDLGERKAALREALLDALNADFPPEYRTWIRSYYEWLMGREGRESAPQSTP